MKRSTVYGENPVYIHENLYMIQPTQVMIGGEKNSHRSTTPKRRRNYQNLESPLLGSPGMTGAMYSL